MSDVIDCLDTGIWTFHFSKQGWSKGLLHWNTFSARASM